MELHHKPELDDSDRRHGKLTRIGAIDYGDDDGRLARLRRQLRNPSLITFFILAIIAISIPVGIAFPGFYSGAKEGIVRIRQDPVVHFLEVATPSFVYPYLQRNIEQMKSAQSQYEWRRISFKLGPCFEPNLGNSPTANTPKESHRPARTSTRSNSTSPKTATHPHPATSPQPPSPALTP